MRSLRRWWHKTFDELNPIAEWVSELEPVVTRDRNTIHDFDPERAQLIPPARKIRDFISDVSLCQVSVNAVLDTDVHLAITQFEPKSAAFAEAGRLFDFQQAQNLAIKMASLIFSPSWDRQLNVVDPSNHVLAPFLRTAILSRTCALFQAK
jgi:hypothetical protein